LPDRGADAALAALESVVDGGIDYVDAALYRRRNRVGVTLVCLRVGLTQVSADSDGGQEEPLRIAKVAFRGVPGELGSVMFGANRCGGFAHDAPWLGLDEPG